TGGAPSLVASTMMSIWNTVGSLDRAATDAADTAFTALLAATAGGGDRLRDACRSELDASLRASINRYVAANLRHADLSAARVARRFGISLRKLHRLYEGTGQTFTQTVMMLRVEGCARDLASEARQSLTELASRWGFCDLSHLNKVFRTRYDCLPSQYRDVAIPGGGPAEAVIAVR
ncbi:MAG: helix-turn-helix transcriptional regulator, partial [Actinomycetia bacterium]|nr:helix-turn-helix transcriptional regulator [Actinomycetes bacterium]